MPVIIPHDLPAKEILNSENIFVRTKTSGSNNYLKSLKLAIVNLMPTKIETETQLLRMLSTTPLEIDVDFIRVTSHESKNTSKDHLEKFYKTFDEIKEDKYDAMIVTGAPIERIQYTQVDYWEELKQILDFADKKVTSTMFICWGSQAALYHYYGIEKYEFQRKLTGVYKNKVVEDDILTRGFDKYFYAPQSRYTYCKEEELKNIKDLKIIAKSEEAGVHLATTRDNSKLFVFGHSEYDEDTLDKEYRRDLLQESEPIIPCNYYKDDNPSNEILVRWKAHGNLLFNNWINNIDNSKKYVL